MIDEGWNSHGIECKSASFQVLLYPGKVTKDIYRGIQVVRIVSEHELWYL